MVLYAIHKFLCVLNFNLAKDNTYEKKMSEADIENKFITPAILSS